MMRCRFGVALAAIFAVSLAVSAEVLPAQPYAWASVPWGGGGYVPGFAYHPKAKDVLYARTDIGGLYRYDFSAKKWIALTDHIGWADSDLMGVISIALDPNNPDKLYIANGLYLGDWARKGAILRSSDRGRTWEKTELPFRIGGNADGRGSGERLVVDPKDGDVLYYGSNKDGLWKSTDGGKSFSNVGSPAKSISLVAIDPKSGAVFLGSADGTGRLMTSAGGSFVPVEGTPAQIPQHAVFASDGSLYVTFAGTGTGQPVNPSFAESGAVFKRDPNGTWHEITPEKSGKFGYSGVDIGPDGTVAVSTLDRWWPHDEIYVSHDGGGHWLTLSDKAHLDSAANPWVQSVEKMTGRVGHWISDVKINPFNKDEMIYGTGGGVWTSRNFSAAGTSPVEFVFNVADLEETATIQMQSPPAGPRLIAAFGDVGGAAWSDTSKSPSSGLFTPANESNRSIDFAGMKPNVMVRTTDRSPTHGYLSNDGGLTWSAMIATPYRQPQGGEWRGPGAIAVSAKATTLLWVPEKDSAYFSRDNGAIWRPSAGWPAGRNAALIPVADKTVDGVFYVFDRQTGSLLISVDGGASFKAIANGLPQVQGWEWAQLAVVPGRMRDLWLALPSGLIHSRDSATPFSDFKDVTSASAVGFGAPKVPGGYPAVYLSGKVKGVDGLWRSDDEGASWSRINDDAHAFSRVMQITGDPREYGVVYIAPGGRGIQKGTPGK